MDFVEEVLRFLTARMQIEAEWAVQEQTSFTWWAIRWRSGCGWRRRASSRASSSRRCISRPICWRRADRLVDVDAAGGRQPLRDAQRVRRRRRAGTIRLHASVSLTAENYLLAAPSRCTRWRCRWPTPTPKRRSSPTAFGGAGRCVAASACAACATTPDEMVGILEIYQQRGEADSPFNAEELAQLVHLEPRPWLMAANELHRSTPIWISRRICRPGSSSMRRDSTRHSAAACRCA